MTFYSSYGSPPPSSPASSPSPYVDSSPPSSPGTTLFDFDSDGRSCDPFAGSMKATKSPKIYEKKRARSISPSPPPNESKKVRITERDAIEQALANRTRSDTEIWNDVVAEAIDKGHGYVDLESNGLSSIPSRAIIDLSMLYVPSIEQEVSLEQSFGRCQSFSRTKTLADKMGFRREDLQVMLGHNSLVALPQEFFNLQRLTVLSLRSNRLAVFPPEISQLTNLKVLNISSNRLLFLPSELMQLNLDKLLIFPNPFLPPPRDTLQRTRSFARSRSRLSSLDDSTRPCSPIIPIFTDRVIPLLELCLRRLLAPLSDPKTCILRETYHLPLSEDNDTIDGPITKRIFRQPLPPLVRDVLDATCYGSVYVESIDTSPGNSQGSSSLPTSSQSFSDFEGYLKERLDSLVSYHSEYRHVTGKGKCYSPRHAGTISTFVIPAEERFTWEHTVAGVSNLGHVPIRWRGCQKGCLDFLASPPREDPARLSTASQTVLQDNEGGAGSADDQDVLQPVQLSSGFAFDGFGD
ncbi:hypothetical protein V5O48_000018 [Marasmius crinis-equi]|uniref:Leucine rich repeat domain protein n=1 Tax=Marasmius crinis-equi TaxID=585013 RepID=A0ABR3G2Y6_9AGAR